MMNAMMSTCRLENENSVECPTKCLDLEMCTSGTLRERSTDTQIIEECHEELHD